MNARHSMVFARLALMALLVMVVTGAQPHARSDLAGTSESAGTQAVSVSWRLIGGSGTTVVSTPNHQVGLSVGQNAVGAVQTPTHQLSLGFWYGVPSAQWTCPIALTGDVNLSGTIVASDIIYLVNFVFKAGAEPLPCTGSGDVNCSGAISPADIIHLVNHVFKAGPAPCDACSLIPGDWPCP